MRNHIIAALIAVLFFGSAPGVFADKDYSKYAVWITGEAFSDQGVLLFRADQTVEGNITGNLILLGPSRGVMKEFLPLYNLTARKPVRLRARGMLFPAPSEWAATTPSVEFMIDELQDSPAPTAPPAFLLTRR